MKTLYSPQVSTNTVEYSFNGDIITATLNGETDTFDLSNMPNDSVTTSITTTLPNPLVQKAERDINGILKVVLYNPISVDATEAERFPEWEEV